MQKIKRSIICEKSALFAFFAFFLCVALSVRAELWALPNVSEANVRSMPAHSAELTSQFLLGTPLKIIRSEGEWVEVTGPEGYSGWVNGSSLSVLDDEQMSRWRESDRVIVTSFHPVKVYVDSIGTDSRNTLATVVQGNILQGSRGSGTRTKVVLPDGFHGWIPTECISNLEEWAKQAFNPDAIIDMASSMMGTPYLWGGTTSKAMDCSGLVKILFLANGFIMPRDASQQADIGTRLDPRSDELQRGDLVFFGNDVTGKVTHVGIYDDNSEIVHASGRVRRNSLDPDAGNFIDRNAWFAVNIRSAINDGTLPRAAEHTWYFNIQ